MGNLDFSFSFSGLTSYRILWILPQAFNHTLFLLVHLAGFGRKGCPSGPENP